VTIGTILIEEKSFSLKVIIAEPRVMHHRSRFYPVE